MDNIINIKKDTLECKSCGYIFKSNKPIPECPKCTCFDVEEK